METTRTPGADPSGSVPQPTVSGASATIRGRDKTIVAVIEVSFYDINNTTHHQTLTPHTTKHHRHHQQTSGFATDGVRRTVTGTGNFSRGRGLPDRYPAIVRPEPRSRGQGCVASWEGPSAFPGCPDAQTSLRHGHDLPTFRGPARSFFGHYRAEEVGLQRLPWLSGSLMPNLLSRLCCEKAQPEVTGMPNCQGTSDGSLE
jgi:hypothetical protein